MKVIGRPEWVTDARFARYGDRRDNWSEMMQGVESWSRGVSTQECLVALNAEGVPASAYRTVAEALRDPQLVHRRALSEVEDAGGTFRVLNVPFRMSGADVRPAGRMATLGEHTRALLREAGLSDEQLASFSGKAARAAQG
jgi:crotonobetainyl-CoA:carnitine CoA-transferase CaiB-like acyl-CoA transferase